MLYVAVYISYDVHAFAKGSVWSPSDLYSVRCSYRRHQGALVPCVGGTGDRLCSKGLVCS